MAMLRVGLTGGIGSGKSTVAAMFRDLGVPIIDTDEISHGLVGRGSDSLAEIAVAFGPSVLTPDGNLDRAALRKKVFGNSGQRRRLETILHPRIRAEVSRRIAELDAPYCMIVVPLLVEANFLDIVDRVLVVDTDERTQIARTRTRSGLTAEEVHRILGAQASREERLSAADDVIRNVSGRHELRKQVAALHDQYLALARRA
jgi:dephospho-CoA kinase